MEQRASQHRQALSLHEPRRREEKHPDVQHAPQDVLPAPTPLVVPHAAGNVDARWAAYLEKYRKISAVPAPSDQGDTLTGESRMPESGVAGSDDAQQCADGGASAAPRSEPPASEDGLLRLEREISALRPRPNDEQAEAYRPSDLSLLFEATPTDTSARALSSEAAPAVPESGRGNLPRPQHEQLTPPPPPMRRNAAAAFADDDELPTQAKAFRALPANPPPRPSGTPQGTPSLPPPGFLNRQRTSILPPPPAGAAPGQRGHDRLPTPLPSPLPPPPVLGHHASPLPPLPLPPPLPRELNHAVHHAAPFNELEWTDAKQYDIPRVRPLPPPVASPLRLAAVPPPAMPAADPFRSPSALPHAGPDSVRPLTTSVAPQVTGWWALPSGWLPVAAAGVVGASVTALALTLPQKGQLLVDVSNQHWTEVAGAQIYLNGEVVCSSSPCAVKLDADSEYRVRAEAPGYQGSVEQTVAVTKDSVTLHKIQLGASADTGIDITTSVPNLQLYVDGRRVGSLPRKVMGLTPGEHTVLVSGGPQFEAVERQVTIAPNQLLAISDLEPKLIVGQLELSRGDNSQGATALLDGQPITLPYAGKLDPDKSYHLTVTRDGYRPYERTIEFHAHQPVIKEAVALQPLASEASAVGASAATEGPAMPSSRSGVARAVRRDQEPSHVSSPTRADDAPETAPSSAPAVTQKAVLNIVTSPSSLVLLDGKPIGKTPKRLSIDPGKHSVVLLHEGERKRATIALEPGSNKTIKASF